LGTRRPSRSLPEDLREDDPIAHTAQPFTSVGGPGWGSVDYEELTAVVDEAVKRFDFVDPDRLG
jgi:hypothetical protein